MAVNSAYIPALSYVLVFSEFWLELLNLPDMQLNSRFNLPSVKWEIEWSLKLCPPLILSTIQIPWKLSSGEGNHDTFWLLELYVALRRSPSCGNNTEMFIKNNTKFHVFGGWKGELVVRKYVSQTKDHHSNQITHQPWIGFYKCNISIASKLAL